MNFEQTSISGVRVVHQDRKYDDRGYFTALATWDWVLPSWQSNCYASFNVRAGTLRGIHYMAAPCSEAKIVRCTRGAIFDVAVDLRRDSPTVGQWFGVTLDEENGKQLLIPQGCAHGFITLVDATEVAYQIMNPRGNLVSRGVAWNDPDIGIKWPIKPVIMSDRDRSLPFLKDLPQGDMP